VVFSLRTSFQVPNDGFSFWEPRFRSISRSGLGAKNLDSGPLSRILATSVQVLEAVSWVITVTEIKIPKSKNSSTYPGPLPPFYKAHHSGVCLSVRPGSAWKVPEQTDRQTHTTVALIYKIDVFKLKIKILRK